MRDLAGLGSDLPRSWQPNWRMDGPRYYKRASRGPSIYWWEPLIRGVFQTGPRLTLRSGFFARCRTACPKPRASSRRRFPLDPNDARTYLHLGETRLYLGQAEAGIPPLEQAIRLRPNDPNIVITYWASGTCQLLLGRVDQAIDLL